MSSIAFVRSDQVVSINDLSYANCPKTENIPCESAVPQGIWWAEPYITSTGLTRYNYLKEIPIQYNGTPPADWFRVLRIWNTLNDTTLYIAVDADGEADFVDACNGCCGETPVMPTVTIPAAIIEVEVCANEAGNFVIDFPLPYNPNNLPLQVGNPVYINGSPAAALTPFGPFANPAAMLAEFVSTYSTTYGTWSLQNSNKVLRLTGTVASSAGVDIQLVAASYCFQIPGTNTTVDGIRFNATNALLPSGQIIFSNATATSRNAIAAALSQVLVGTVEVVGAGPYYIKYTGLQVPSQLTLAGANVSGTVFATGTCP